MSILRKIENLTIGNFMWWQVIAAIISLVWGFIPIRQLFMILCFFCGVIRFTQIKRINSLDAIIMFYLVYVILNAVAIDYPNHFYFLVHAFIFQFCPIMCYFMARTNDLELEEIFKKMLIPMTIVMLVGIYLYFAEPSWYMAIKWARIYEKYGDYANDNSIIAQMRMTSIFDSSFYLAYATFFFSAYLLFALSFKSLKTSQTILYVILIAVCVVVLMLANHRTTILGFVIAYLYCYIKGKKKGIRVYMLLGAGAIAIIVIALIFSSQEYLDYIKMRFTEVSTDEGFQERLEHTGGGQNLLTLFGDGYGHHSLRAREYGGWALIDSQYQKELGELGIFGFSIFVFMLLITGLRAINKRNGTGLELCVFLFYLEAFIGASALSIDSEYSIIFWYALGKISQKSSQKSIYKPMSATKQGNLVLSSVKS